MKFDDLDQRMRIFETAYDLCVLPGISIVVRLDGRSFTRLTRETLHLEAPFDDSFRDAMVGTTEHLLSCGFEMTYGYIQSDEISLLLVPNDVSFGRKIRKLESILAGEASGKMSLLLGRVVAFDGRVCQLPRAQDVVDYFRWRQEDAHRNGLNAHCYWALRGNGLSAAEATRSLMGLSVRAKNELLFQQGVNFNDLPAWQKRGIAVYWELHEKMGENPLTGESTPTLRRRLRRDLELPMKDEYDTFVRARFAGCE